jgi:hypothetical protein
MIMVKSKTVNFTKEIKKTVFRKRSYLKNKLQLTLNMETDPKKKWPYENTRKKAKPSFELYLYFGSQNVKKYWAVFDMTFVKGRYKLDNKKRTFTYMIPEHDRGNEIGVSANAYEGANGFGGGGLVIDWLKKKTPIVIHFNDTGWNKFTKTLNEFKKQVKTPAEKTTTRKRKTPAKKTTTRKRKTPAKKTTTKKRKTPAKKTTTRKRKTPAKKKATTKKKTVYRGKRPSPSASATSVTIGTKRRGGDGKMYVCKSYKRGNKRVKRWVKA